MLLDMKIWGCGMKISVCCMVLSIWGIIMLVFLGIFFNAKSVALYEDFNGAKPPNTTVNCFIAAGLYVITLILSIHQRAVNKRIQQFEALE